MLSVWRAELIHHAMPCLMLHQRQWRQVSLNQKMMVKIVRRMRGVRRARCAIDVLSHVNALYLNTEENCSICHIRLSIEG